jgi:hypothetical protein
MRRLGNLLERLRPLALVLATGYVLYFFSEFAFWSGGEPGSLDPQNMAVTWLAYSLLAYPFLAAVRLAHARAPWGLFLAGAIFGWLAEGVIVQTMVEELPLSISFTGLAWHALITVLGGWYGMRRALLDDRVRMRAAAPLVAGLIWGLWAITWWVEPGGIRLAPGVFAGWAFLTTGLLVLANRVIDLADPAGFRPNRWVLIAVGAGLAIWLVIVAAPAAPLALVAVPVMIGLAVWGLWRGRRAVAAGFADTEKQGVTPMPDALSAIAGPLGRRSLWLLLMPLAAGLVYTAADMLGLLWPTSMALYLVTMPLGFILLAISLWHVGRGDTKYEIRDTSEE